MVDTLACIVPVGAILWTVEVCLWQNEFSLLGREKVFTLERAFQDKSRFEPLSIICGCGEMVDTLASGASGSNPVEVQVLSSAPKQQADP